MRSATENGRETGHLRHPSWRGLRPDKQPKDVTREPERVDVDVDGRQLSLSNLDKVLFPATGFTKGDMIHYYAAIADAMLPHVRNRPMTLKRYPNGVEGQFFFEKHAPRHTPDWVETTVVRSASKRSSSSSEVVEYVVAQDRPTLVWAANLASIEFHVPQWQIGDGGDEEGVVRPDLMVLDLDPGPGTSVVECCRVAVLIAKRFGKKRLFPKTSGSKDYSSTSRVLSSSPTKSSPRHMSLHTRSRRIIPSSWSRTCERNSATARF